MLRVWNFLLCLVLVVCVEPLHAQSLRVLEKAPMPRTFANPTKITNALPKKDSLLRFFLGSECYCDLKATCPGQNFYYTGRQIVSTYSMNRLIRQDLTKITLDEEGLPSLGNYATTQLSDDKSKVTFNTSIYNPFQSKEEFDPIRTLLSFNVKAATKDNVSKLFSNKSASNEVAVKIKLTFLSKNTLYENDDQMACNQMKLNRQYLLHDYKNAYLRYKADSAIDYRRWVKDTLTANGLLLSLKYIDTLMLNSPDTVMKLLQAKRDSLQLLYLDFQTEMDTRDANQPRYDSLKLLDSFYLRLLNTETKTAKWTNFRMAWTDFDVSIGGEKYNLIDGKQVIDSQLMEKKFTRLSFGISRNVFSSTNLYSKHGTYLKYYYQLTNDNSLTGTDPKEVSTRNIIDTPGYRREVLEKKSAFDVPYIENLSHLFGLRLAKYLNENHSQAFTINTTLVLKAPSLKEFYRVSNGPNITPGIGYLYSFLNKDKDKALVNMELFLNLADVFNSSDKHTRFYERNELGIRVGVPFNSIFLNNL